MMALLSYLRFLQQSLKYQSYLTVFDVIVHRTYTGGAICYFSLFRTVFSSQGYLKVIFDEAG